MRHGKRRTRFGRQRNHRIATLKSIAKSVIVHQSIRTTHVKAKEARRVVEGLISTAKKDTLDARRQAYSLLGDRSVVLKLFKEVMPLFATRQSGFTRIIHHNFRKGDGASMVILELTEKKPEEKKKPIKKADKAKKEVPAKKEEPKAQPKPAPEVKPQVKEEKTTEEVKKERAKDEQKKMIKQKGFLKKMGGFFRRKTNM